MSYPPPRHIRTLDAAARVIGCTADDLRTIASDADQRRYYERLRIPKKGRRRGEFRTVYHAHQRLALIHKNIGTWISEHIDFPDYVQGFVSKRSIVTNARLHLGQRVLLHADIKDFFDSITRPQVVVAFTSIAFSPSLADVLAGVCTLNGQLPQGTSASPAIANIVCQHLDTDMNTLAIASGCTYSRYADDITISGDQVPESAELQGILEKYGFSLRSGSCRTQRKGHSQFVTGLTISDPKSPRIPRVTKRRLRLQLHYAARFGMSDHLAHIGSDDTPEFAVNQLHGWMSFIFSVEGKSQQRLYDKWRKVSAEVYGEPLDEERGEPESYDVPDDLGFNDDPPQED
jgi:retron-type reverse transcriptase